MKKGFLILLCLLIASITHAGTYRWVDENSQIHFGDRPPANAAPEEVTLKSATPAADAAVDERKRRVNEFLEQSGRERAERNRIKAEQEARSAKLESRCQALRARLRYLKSVSGIYRLNNDGERVFVDDEENMQLRRDFQARVQSECDS
ncbi:DUF4124 domain-containing protein [Marinobacter sp. HL-58]|uniref:DUF4124 domain-containing protein n=1 Tax=Marinobacter sp. HL-58 TaxID=1479237 RepID=UPI000689B290|nr:DUF4124 domain-containing protein [Marinobacter sp. HL-58]KPP97390.1 MAG: protein of unknown function containing DUF4124 domain [Marinobacter sp. HL-58]